MVVSCLSGYGSIGSTFPSHAQTPVSLITNGQCINVHETPHMKWNKGMKQKQKRQEEYTRNLTEQSICDKYSNILVLRVQCCNNFSDMLNEHLKEDSTIVTCVKINGSPCDSKDVADAIRGYF